PALPGATLEPVAVPIAPAAPAADAPASPVVAAASPGSGEGPLDSALAIVALAGAGGAALVRARQLAAASGLADTGALTALGHSASTFWAGSCTAIGGSSSLTASGTSLAAPASSTVAFTPVGTLGGRARFGVAGALSEVADGLGGRVTPAALPLRSGHAADRTGLVTLLLAASAASGAALAALLPQRGGAQGADAG
ncbi:MAG TPA: hypothetical protein VGK92_05950, partial [Gaiellales bacterium]